MPSNTAAWQKEAKAKPLQVKEAPYTPPQPGEIVIKNHAVAINPVDSIMQTSGIFPISYPHILGSDVAGEVVEIGQGVTRFALGDRVIGFAFGCAGGTTAEGAFQEYTVLQAHVASSIPAELSFSKAAVMPMGLIVAASGLFEEDYLGLRHPSLGTVSPGDTLLIWGGATSIGCSAIQLATAAGYKVIATASTKNFDLLRRLGASQVFDYHSDSVVDDIVASLDGKTVVGAFDAAGKTSSGVIAGADPDSSFYHCASVLQRTKGSKFIAAVQFLPEQLPENIKAKFIVGFNIKNTPFSKVIFDDFIPQALANGKFVAAPDSFIVGHGLESIQTGLDTMSKGVSARKLVVTL